MALLVGTTSGQQTAPATKVMNELGPENSQLAQRVGTWDVVETVWASPGAAPTSNKFVAERRMIGSFLQETIAPAADSHIADFRRIYYLSFNRIEGRWKYVSIDTRNPVGLMPASSFGRGENGKLSLFFEPFSLAGSNQSVSGQMLRMEEDIVQQGSDHELAQERFIVADGSGTEWLAFQYEYVRRAEQANHK